MHGLGISEAVAGTVPDALVPVLRVLTFLGDPVLFLVAAPLLYWIGPRYDLLGPRNAARVLAVTIGGLSLVVALKSLFAFPRPPPGIALIAADGYGFPSGHATGSTVFYGTAAALLGVRTRRTRFAVAAAVVALVASTRVALGVHYALDVTAGVLVGSVYTALALRASRDRVGAGFAFALALGTAALLLAGTVEAAVAFGATAGGALAWPATKPAVGRLEDLDPRYAVLLVPLVTLGGLTLALEPALPLAVVASAMMGVGLVGAPTRLQKRSR